MTCHSKLSRGGAAALTLMVLIVLAFAGVQPARSDDTDLLRFNTAKPYVFFLVDTSASMTLSPQGEWVHANGDDPRSKLYQAKRILYEVFQEVDDVHFGLAYGNQDKSAITNKHWLYYHTGSLPGGWPINYPRADVDGPVQTQADGTAVSDVEGDLMTFGAHLDATGVAGTCTAPLSLSTQREKISRYSKLGATGSQSTVIWLSDAGKTYRLTVSRPGNKPDTTVNPQLGVDGMNVRLTLDQISNCTGPVVARTFTGNLDLKLWTDFVMFDENAGSVTAPNGSKAGGVDYVAGFWDAKDVVDQASCGSGHPFSGKGWEGNYDGSVNTPVPSGIGASLKPTEDPFCLNPANAATCSNLKERTQFDSFGRALDRGDMIPLDWRVENKQAFLDRMAPNQSSGTPDFRIASYFKNNPDAVTGALQPLNSGQVPLYGTGASPLGKMVIDFRCWFLGEGNKCNEGAYNPGWQDIAQRYDTEWGCRRPYLIVLSDGGDTCPGENPCADTANLNSRGAVRTWVIAYGADCAKAGNPLKCMAQNGKGELLCPQTATDLKTELLKILGQIREEARAFASAAVPSVQAIVEDKIFLTNFTPLNGRSVWDGHVNSFLKPLPLGTDGKPDTTHDNHLWDGGEVIKTQVNASDPLGSAANQRRVYYARDSANGLLVDRRRLLDPTFSTTTATDVRRDLWRGFEIPFIAGDIITETLAELRANTVIQKTLAVKTHTLTTVDPATGNPVTKTLQYLLGDIFHSNPLVIGSPPNTTYFSSDVNGYRDFFRKHELRRKLLIVGSNDGMLHVFDAGKYDSSTEKFDNGTGKELFAYIPREVMPTVRRMAESTVHQWGVDGTVTVADVFIDPKHSGTPDEDDREWRTMVFGGLREGGASYFALDITQPDMLTSAAGLDNVPQAVNGYVPSCDGGDNGVVDEDDCGPVPFPAVLWEFSDTVRNAANFQVKLDEDVNGEPDFGDTWSIPNVGRIRISEGGDTVEKHVMVIGGGFDPDNKTSPLRGNWLYIVDVETGKALYKRQLTGAAPSEPAAVDTNQDGFLDRIYIGTTAGLMYRIDLLPDSSGVYPSLVDQPVRGLDGVTYTVKRIASAAWAPKAIFNSNTENGAAMAAGQSRPIFYRPSVIFVTKLGKYALSFGTGDREDLWNNTGTTGRFYIFVDDSDALATGTVTDESRFQRITVTSGAATGEYLFSGLVGQRGWYLVLDANERLITDPFALSGVSFFSTFKPDVEVTGGKDPLCSKTGLSRIFVVSTVNGNPFLSDVNESLVRNLEVKNFVTNPFTEAGLTKNTSGSGSGSTPAEICDTPTLNKLKQSLQTLFPARCKFSNQTVDIKTISADTRLLCIAPVPVCTIEKNWREH